jgi:hypothetical protein
MYCPKCSQPISADGTRFCSRCGFTLTSVGLLLENNGVLPQPQAHEKVPLSRNRIMLEGGVLTVVGWLIVFIAMFWFNAHGPFEAVATITAVIFAILGVLGLLRFLYGFFICSDRVSSTKLSNSPQDERPLNAGFTQAALPPQQSIPISDYPLRKNTKEMASQPSVTEHTTRLLDE